MIFKRFLPLALAAGVAITPMLAVAPAAADTYRTDAAVGAAVGAIVSSLLFDDNRNQYYYYEGRRPMYVSDPYARRWFQHRDPDYWRMHRHEYRDSRADFAHGWEMRHGDRDWRGGERDWHHDDHDWRHGDRDWRHDDHDGRHGDHDWHRRDER